MIVCMQVHRKYCQSPLSEHMGNSQGKGKVEEIVSYFDMGGRWISGENKIRQCPHISCRASSSITDGQ